MMQGRPKRQRLSDIGFLVYELRDDLARIHYKIDRLETRLAATETKGSEEESEVTTVTSVVQDFLPKVRRKIQSANRRKKVCEESAPMEIETAAPEVTTDATEAPN